jgi:hypothetical protein
VSNINQSQVIEAEERLMQAMLHSDTQLLDELISADLLFTGHVGQLVTKADDLAFHQARILRLSSIEPVERHIQLHPGFAVVSTLMHLVGTYEGAAIDQRMRYTRIWLPTADGKLQLIAGHMSEVQDGG